MTVCACLQVRHLVQEQHGAAVLMAYGISAAGKTYTIEGSRSEPGLLPRALDLLFQVPQPSFVGGLQIAVTLGHESQ